MVTITVLPYDLEVKKTTNGAQWESATLHDNVGCCDKIKEVMNDSGLISFRYNDDTKEAYLQIGDNYSDYKIERCPFCGSMFTFRLVNTKFLNEKMIMKQVPARTWVEEGKENDNV